jgi:hypothetical protein
VDRTQPGKGLRDYAVQGDLLIDKPAVNIPVRNYKAVFCKGRSYNFSQMGCMVSNKKKGLSYGIRLFPDGTPDCLPDPCRARFTGDNRVKV